MTAPRGAQVYDWFLAKQAHWRSWVGHTLIVLGIAWLFSPDVALFCYFWREGEQAWDKHRKGEPQDWADNILDAAVPLVSLAVLHWVFGWFA